MKRLSIILSAIGFLLFAATACQEDGKTPTASLENDETAIEEMATSDENELLFDALVDDGSEDNMYDGFSTFDNNMGKVTAPIDSVWRFGRRFNPQPRRAIRDFRRISEDTALVAVHRLFTGQFVIFEKNADSTGNRRAIIHRKRLNHATHRNAIFVKRETDTGRMRWQLDAVSFGQGESRPETTIDILETHITSDRGLDLLITDPLQTFLNSRDEIPSVVPGETVTVQIKLNNSTAHPVDLGNGATETVLLHYGINLRHRARARFEYTGTDPVNGAQIYVGSWTINQRPGHVYHAAFDVIDNGTIFDDDATVFPYNSMVWSLPYRVAEVD